MPTPVGVNVYPTLAFFSTGSFVYFGDSSSRATTKVTGTSFGQVSSKVSIGESSVLSAPVATGVSFSSSTMSNGWQGHSSIVLHFLLNRRYYVFVMTRRFVRFVSVTRTRFMRPTIYGQFYVSSFEKVDWDFILFHRYSESEHVRFQSKFCKFCHRELIPLDRFDVRVDRRVRRRSVTGLFYYVLYSTSTCHFVHSLFCPFILFHMVGVFIIYRFSRPSTRNTNLFLFSLMSIPGVVFFFYEVISRRSRLKCIYYMFRFKSLFQK